MGSKRKKAEKHKDFTKAKLRVGKTAAKADNHTDTSFTAKTISLPNQSLNKKQVTSALTTSKREEVDLTHQLSLTKHHSSDTRKEILNQIQQHLPSNPSLYKQILTSIIPLILDQSQKVRNALMALFSACTKKQPGLLDLHLRSIILFIHSAMTHLQPAIRNDSSKFLQILCDHAPQSLVKSYYIKTLKNYFTLLAWTINDDKKQASLAITTSVAIGGPSKKARIDHLHTLKKFLDISLFAPSLDTAFDFSAVVAIHPQSLKYIFPTTPQPFSPLNLFNPNVVKQSHGLQQSGVKDIDDGSFSFRDLDTISAEDLETRRKIMFDVFEKPIIKNLRSLVKEGGEVGREANSCMVLLTRLQNIKEKEV